MEADNNPYDNKKNEQDTDPAPGTAVLFRPVLWRVQALLAAAKDRPVMISVDGNCGSGKTLLAEWLAGQLPCNVYHTDDYYLPWRLREENWQSIPAGNMDLRRLSDEVLRPAARGETVTGRPYSCPEKAYGEPKSYPPRPLTIIEGTYSQHPLLAEYYALNVFLHCSAATQRSRLQAREGAHYEAFEKIWIPMEENYFANCRKITENELCIDTDETTR